MAKIYVYAGHGAGDPGACANGFQEAERARALAKRIKELGGDNVVLGDLDKNYYKEAYLNHLEIPHDWQIVELHLDSASNKMARGGHVIINAKFEPDEYDNKLADFITKEFPGRPFKISKRSDLAEPNRAAAKGYPYRLIECCFISNADDIKKFNAELDVIAKGIIECFGNVVETKVEKPTPAPAPAKTLASAESFEDGHRGGTVLHTTDALNLRLGAGVQNSIITTLPYGSKVVWYGYYTMVGSSKWILVSASGKTGFVNSAYVK